MAERTDARRHAVPRLSGFRASIGLSIVAVAAFSATALGVSGGETITTIAGSGTAGYSGDGGPATSARLRLAPYGGGVAVDGQGNVYIADPSNHRVRKVSPGGTITTVAGTGVRGFDGDGGPAKLARLFTPTGVAVDSQGNLYIADTSNNRVRKVSGGTITTIAGSGRNGFGGDGGPATSARLTLPDAVAVDGNGNVYIADTQNQRVRRVSSAGTIATVAGTGVVGFSGDGGPAVQARIAWPEGVAADDRGNVYIADSRNNRVRKVSPDGTITTFAGTGLPGFSGDGGPATAARLALWHDSATQLAVDGQGNVYIADARNGRIRKVSTGGTITTIAGTSPLQRFGGDGGPANKAQLSWPQGVAVDGKGNVYIADTYNHRIRKITAGDARLSLTLGGPLSQRLVAEKSITVTAQCDKPCSLAATGSVTILGTRLVFALAPAAANRAAGKRTLALRFPAAQEKRFRQHSKPGQRAQALVVVKATDAAGNRATSKRLVSVTTR